MDTVKINSKNVKMIAHRGLSGLEKENTAAAFVAAGNRQKYFGIETDVHTTKDGKFIILHDADLKRVANVDLNVEQAELAESQSRVMINWHGKAPRTDYRTPALEDYLEICKKYGKHAILEIKCDMDESTLAGMFGIIKDYGMFDDTVIISFIADVLVRVRKMFPDFPIQFLTGGCDEKTVEFLEKNCFGLDIYYPSLTEDMIKLLHSKGIEVNIWTCDSKEDAEKYISWGVDYITSNILE